MQLLVTDFTSLPDLRAALLGQLQQYPSARNGLSWLEQSLLGVILANGEISPVRILGEMIGGIMERGWGDGIASDTLRQFVLDWNQPVRFAVPFQGEFSNYEFNGSRLTLTDFGAKVLAAEADYVAFNGIDRWIGGVHLQGQRVSWRWDQERMTVVPTEA